MAKRGDYLLTKAERDLLRELADGPVKVFIYRAGKPDHDGLARVKELDLLAARGFATFRERRGDMNSPDGNTWQVYEANDLGSCFLQIAEGTYECDPEDLEHPGCG